MKTWSQELKQQLQGLNAARFADSEARELTSIDSTNSELMRQAQAGCVHPQIVWAHTQTAGRGRLGRVWHSSTANNPSSHAAPGSLCFSIGLPLAPQNWSGLSLVVGLALAQSLHASVGLKWPNDLWVQQAAGHAKLGGILIETAALPAGTQADARARWLVIGIGINLQHMPPASDLRTPATSIQAALPAELAQTLLADVGALCSQLALAVMRAVLQFEQTGFAPFASAFGARDVLCGQTISSSAGMAGRALGVASDGSYQLQTADGLIHAINSAEISLRPAP